MKFKEDDIRPSDLFERFIGLCEKDSQTFFGSEERYPSPCPGCGGSERKEEFKKWGFAYSSCTDCSTLYQTPRPPQELLDQYYKDSPSVNFWAKELMPKVEESRSKHLFGPKARQIAELCRSHGINPQVTVDVGAGAGGLLQEWRTLHPQGRHVALEPNPVQAEKCRNKQFEVIEKFAENASDIHAQCDLTISLEVLEHVYNPVEFCSSVRRLLNENGVSLFTTLTIDGFDIQTLWEQSRAIAPPQHLNFISQKGLAHLMKRAGYASTVIFTPGKLDVDIVSNAALREDRPLSPFINHLLTRPKQTTKAFQDFLQRNNLSSHCWILAFNGDTGPSKQPLKRNA